MIVSTPDLCTLTYFGQGAFSRMYCGSGDLYAGSVWYNSPVKNKGSL